MPCIERECHWSFQLSPLCIYVGPHSCVTYYSSGVKEGERVSYLLPPPPPPPPPPCNLGKEPFKVTVIIHWWGNPQVDHMMKDDDIITYEDALQCWTTDSISSTFKHTPSKPDVASLILPTVHQVVLFRVSLSTISGLWYPVLLAKWTEMLLQHYCWSTATYTCTTGYLRTSGSPSRTCQSNHQWSGTHPTCTRKSTLCHFITFTYWLQTYERIATII